MVAIIGGYAEKLDQLFLLSMSMEMECIICGRKTEGRGIVYWPFAKGDMTFVYALCSRHEENAETIAQVEAVIEREVGSEFN